MADRNPNQPPRLILRLAAATINPCGEATRITAYCEVYCMLQLTKPDRDLECQGRSLEDAEKAFREAGLFALALQETLLFLGRVSEETERGSISVDGDEVSVISYPHDGRDGEQILIEDPSFVENVDGQWQFRNDPPAIFGGINPYAVRHSTDSLDSAIWVAQNYYFGEPVVLDGWIIPIHRHPAWDVDAVRAAWERQTRSRSISLRRL